MVKARTYGDAHHDVRRPVPRDQLLASRTKEIHRLFGFEHSHQAIRLWVHRVANNVGDSPKAKSTRIVVDGAGIKINGEWS